MKLTNKILYVFLMMIIFSVSMSANAPFARLPSEQTKNQINEMTSVNNRLPTRNWWTGNDLGQGPPTEGGGIGGAVGVPLTNGIAPIFIAGLFYISFIVLRENRKRIRSIKNKTKPFYIL